MLKPISEIKIDLGINTNGRIQKFLTQTCYNHMDKYVPKDTGSLRDNVDLKADSITYQSNYAEEQYKGIVHGSPVKNYTTPGTGPYWDKRMVSAEINEVVEELQKEIERESK